MLPWPFAHLRSSPSSGRWHRWATFRCDAHPRAISSRFVGSRRYRGKTSWVVFGLPAMHVAAGLSSHYRPNAEIGERITGTQEAARRAAAEGRERRGYGREGWVECMITKERSMPPLCTKGYDTTISTYPRRQSTARSDKHGRGRWNRLRDDCAASGGRAL